MRSFHVRAGSLVAAICLLAQSSLATDVSPSPPPSAPAASGDERVAKLPEHRQLIVVTAPGWNHHAGRLSRFELQGTQWAPVGQVAEVNLGRRGLAWGRGLTPIGKSGLRKKEGDGRSPAGIFALGTAFGAERTLPEGAQGYPYLAAGPSNYCVEDVRSEYYNQLIDANDVATRGWQRWSALARSDGLFDWGVFVEHNTTPTRVGRGSCIFLHVWRAKGVGTSGCTAMPIETARALVAWLDVERRPLLVQLPESVYEELAPRYDLPPVIVH